MSKATTLRKINVEMFGKDLRRKGDEIPLYSMKANGGQSAELARLGSCFQDPQDTALDCILTRNLAGLTNILADAARLGDDDFQVETAKQDFPLPEDHWINQPTSKQGKFRTLLHISIEDNFTEAVSLLLRTGARANLYNEDLGLAPVHVAIQAKNIEILELLSSDRRNKCDFNSVMRNGRTPLHLAVESNSLEVVQFVLNQELLSVDPEDLMGRQTPLYLAVTMKNSEIVRLLVENGASPLRTVENKTIGEYLTEKMPYFDVENVVVQEKSGGGLGADLAYALNRVMDKAQVSLVRGESLSQHVIQFQTIMQALIRCCNENKKSIDRIDCGYNTPMQKACDYGLAEFVKILLDNGANPNSTRQDNTTRPILLAAYQGHHQVLRILIQHKIDSLEGVVKTNLDVAEHENKKNILHHVLSKANRGTEQKENDYAESLNILLSCKDKVVTGELDRLMNRKDQLGNTPLHYATQLWDQGTVRQLLERGCNVGVKNQWDDTPIAKIRPETMEDFLNDFCLTSKNDVNHEDFELKFNYSFLAPPVDHPLFDEKDEEGQRIIENLALPETETLWYMAQSKPHRHLLKNPVITSFLWMKWQRIRKYFNRNVRLYLLYVMCLTWFIFQVYGGVSYRTIPVSNSSDLEPDLKLNLCSDRRDANTRGFWYYIFIIHSIGQIILISRDWCRECKQSDFTTALQAFLSSWIEFFILCAICVLIIFSSDALTIILTILIGLVSVREVLQMLVSLKRYIFDLENLLEVMMLVISVILLYVPDHTLNYDPEDENSGCNVKRHLAAFAIVLAWATFITLVGRHPKLARYNIYVTMFFKVMKSFILFLTWYSFFIIAFGLGFYIMLHKDIPNYTPGEDDYEFFNSPWLSLVKTSTMFVGEIEFSDVPIALDSRVGILGYIFLLSFVFLIVVVLMNLLNGLAVSDTGIIREEAEIVTYISRVETISCTEAVLLGDPFDFLSNWPAIKYLKSIPSLAFCRSIHQNDLVRDISHKITGATGILLFYTKLNEKFIILKPNKPGSRFSCVSLEEMGQEVISAAKNIVISKEQLAADKKEEEGLIQRINKIEHNQINLNNQIKGLANKLDKILEKLG